MLSLWSVRTVCVWITGRKDSCCLTVTSMCWEMRNMTRLEELPLERFNVEEIPLEGEVVEEHCRIYRCILLYRSDQSLCRICTEFAKA